MILTCKQLVEKVTDAREGKLSRLDRVGWAVHLAWCRRCPTYVAQVEETVAALGSLAAREPERAPREVREAVLARLRDRSRR